MLNEERVKHMVKLASYETKHGEEDIKVCHYSQKDYVTLNVLFTMGWATLGYLLLVGLLCMTYIEAILDRFSFVAVILTVIFVIAIYAGILVANVVFANRFYRRKYMAAKRRTDRYLLDLEILEKLYESEDV